MKRIFSIMVTVRRARVAAAAAAFLFALTWRFVATGAEAEATGPATPRSPEIVTGQPQANHGKAALGYVNSAPGQGMQTTAPVKRDIPTTPVEVVARPGVLRLTGVLAPDEKSEVASNASGIVLEVRVDSGSIVKKGDVLARLDPTDTMNQLDEALAASVELAVRLGLSDVEGILKAARDPGRQDVEQLAMEVLAKWKVEDQPEVQTAQAALDLATANYKRYKELSGQGVVSKSQYDDAENAYQTARLRHQQSLQDARQMYQSYLTALARLRTLRKAVADTTIYAPFDGWVAQKFIARGERIAVGPGGAGKVALLLRINPIRLSLTVPQQQTAAIKPGQTVTFRVDSYPGRTFTGETRYISPSVNNDSRSLMVEAVVPNPEHLLRPGLFATAELQLDGQTQDIFVPSVAVRKEGDVARLFVARDGVAHEVIVSPGETLNNRVLILSGLTPADRVVLAPEKVKDGDRIQ